MPEVNNDDPNDVNSVAHAKMVAEKLNTQLNEGVDCHKNTRNKLKNLKALMSKLKKVKSKSIKILQLTLRSIIIISKSK